MTDIDRPCHIVGENKDGSAPYVKREVVLWQSHLDGICQLLAWLQGFEAAGKGNVPGHFELVMHYREIAGKARRVD